MTKARDVVSAVHALVGSALPGVNVELDQDSPERVPAGGLVIVHYGDPGDAIEVTLSPLTYHYAHAVRVDIAVPGADIAARDALLDGYLTAIGAAVAGNRTLGGLCDWLEPTPADRGEARLEGGPSHRWASFDVTATYSTPNPLA